jgi:drug/metabolite transporter (DMT)-like permease
MNSIRQGRMEILACALLWSTGGAFIKLVDWNPAALAGARSAIAMLVIALVARKSLRLRLGGGILLAASMNALTMLLFVAANKLTSSANAILLQYASPAYTALFAALVLKERVRPRDIACLALVIAGMLVMMAEKLGGGGILGDVLASLSGLCFALYFVLLRRQRESSTFEAPFLSHAIVALFGIPFYADGAGGLGASGVSGLLFLGVFQIGLSSLLLARGLSKVSALDAMLLATLEPVLNPVWVYLGTGEAPSAAGLTGGAIIVAAVTARGISAGFEARRARAS